MKQMTLTLTDGFKLRNLLKKKISELATELRFMPVTYDKETGNSSIEAFSKKYGSVMEGTLFLLELQKTLGNLNIAIDDANTVVRPLLDTIEVLKNNERVLDSIVSRCTSANLVEKNFNSVTGVYDITEYHLVVSSDDLEKAAALQKNCRREILETEQQISQLNGSTSYPFELSEKIYDYVYEL